MISNWLLAPRQLRLVFLAVMLLLTATLGRLGWLLLAQDRQLSKTRLQDQLESTADLAVAALKTRLAAVEQELAGMLANPEPKAPAKSAIYFRFQPGSVQAWPDNGIAYYPEIPETPEISSGSDASNPVVKAAALMRLAATYLQGGQLQESLKAYEQLAALRDVVIDGVPAVLTAKLGATTVLEQQHDTRSLESQAIELGRELNSGNWRISAAVYDSLYDSLSLKLHGILPAQDKEQRRQPRVALAEGVYWLWAQWKRDPSHMAPGRSSVPTSGGSILLVWRNSANTLTGFAAPAEYADSEWLSELKPKLDARHVRIALGGAPAGGAPVATRLDSELPWTLQIFPTGDTRDVYGYSRTLLLSGMGVLVALILTGAWFIGHAVARELAVARLQSDFVAAVSHEFRTPLTTLCQLSELLKRGRVATDNDRLQYYELMHHESHRLRRLVESLLNFGRLESGTLQFRFEDVDVAALVRQCAEEFAREARARGYHFEVSTRPESSRIRADRETLQCVFFNLLENAVKYSPDCNTVWVDLARNNGRVEISVRDRGVGIPRQEQQRVFEKFVRGAAARSSDVRGTGIGLAMARQIVRAHGGDITVESKPGEGSTFRVALPGWLRGTEI